MKVILTFDFSDPESSLVDNYEVSVIAPPMTFEGVPREAVDLLSWLKGRIEVSQALRRT